jgi:multiple sugar transport system substrate-binding protein
MTKLANQFSKDSKANPQGITVVHVAQPDYTQKLNTAAAGKNLPEMTVIREGDIPEMAARNILKPISRGAANILGMDNLKSDFPPQYWNLGDYKGQHYSIPLDDHPLVLYYNKDMFQKAGISAPPKTWQEFEQDADKLTQNGVMGAAIGTTFDGYALFQTLLAQYGGSLTNQDATKATYNSEAGVKALTYLRDLRKKYSPNVSGTGDPEVTLFKQGKAAMVMHGPWHIGPLEQLKFTGFAPVPQLSGGQKGVWGGSHQLAISTADATKQAAAACWISWLSANSVQWAVAGQVPARNSVRSNTSELQKVAAPIAAVAEAADYSIIPPGGVVDYGAAIFAGGLDRAADSVLLGQQQDVKQALDNAAAKSTQLLKQNKQRYQ